jgi:surfeit locus 1 family protein
MVGLGPAIATALHHEVQGGSQAADDRDESNEDEIYHGGDYPVTSAAPTARFWVVTLASVLGIAIALMLGFWQLSRAAQKIALQETMDARRNMPALDGVAMRDAELLQANLYRPIALRGSWLGQHTVYLVNRQMQGRPGFFVLTPLLLEHSDLAVIVQRGWVPRNFMDRAKVPEVPTPAGMVLVQGRIAPPPGKLYEFSASPAGPIRQNLDVQQYSGELGRSLAAVSVLQTDPPAEGLSRDWPSVNLGVDKHYGYAFQWFALGGLIALLYGWFQIVKRFILPR